MPVELNVELPIPGDLFRHVAAYPAGPMFSLDRIVGEASSSVYVELGNFLNAIPEITVEATLADSQFQFFHGTGPNGDRAARIWFAERYFAAEIWRRRLGLLCESVGGEVRGPPYDLPALEDVQVDEEGLVPLSAFSFDGSRLMHNGHAFTILTTTGSPNSTYWLMNMLYSEGFARGAKVRLDPFLWGPADTYPMTMYKMWMYGRPLDWRRISALAAPEHGRWSSHDRRSEFTDFVWSPRASEVHFVCEEVPKRGTGDMLAASRYLHAVYVPSESRLRHLDGAVRIFDADQLETRCQQHVRSSGKLGTRLKVFAPMNCFPAGRLA